MDHYHIWQVKALSNGRVAAYRNDRPFQHRTQAYRVANREVGIGKAMVHKCTGVKCDTGMRDGTPVLLTPPEGGWPEWATMRAEQIRSGLPPGQWGPWALGGYCRGATIYSRHPSEAPYFFHCHPCLQVLRQRKPPPKEHARRDRGLCVKCGGPALLNGKWTRRGPLDCTEAEAFGVTVARYGTYQHCQSCKRAQLYTL